MKNQDFTKAEIWDIILEMGIATKDELILVTNINGYSIETLNSVIYSRTGYNYVEQLLDEF